jgi:D-alanyl-D-alanine carboxypeptidase
MKKSSNETSGLIERFAPDQPGIALIVMRDGKTILRAARGMANLELGVALTPDHVFRIGSVTKQFTAVAILMLRARGKLALDDRITRYLPGYPVGRRRITIEHLLRHTSGIASYTNMPGFWQKSQQWMTVEDHIAYFKNEPLRFAPGERFEYNNSGYFLLGAIIEKVSGMPYGDFLKRAIFDKLGMTRTAIDDPNCISPGRVSGYQRTDKGVLQIADYLSMTWPYAAGALLSCVDDLAIWDAALYTNKLLPRAQLEAAWQVGSLNDGEPLHYGHGWSLNTHAGNRCIEHSGGINGFVCHAIRIPEQRVFAAVLCNTTAPAFDPQVLALKLAAEAAGTPFRPPHAARLPGTQLARLAGQFSNSQGEQHIWISFEKGALVRRFAPEAPATRLTATARGVDGAYEFFERDGLLRYRLTPRAAGKPQALRVFDREREVFTGVRVKGVARRN